MISGGFIDGYDAPVYEGHVATEVNGGVPTFTYEEIRTAEGAQHTTTLQLSSRECSLAELT